MAFFQGCVFAALLFAVVVSGEIFDCAHYQEGGPCTLDLIPFCLTNGTIISGRCDAQRAVCAEKAVIDETMTACNKPTQVDCSHYNPNICPRDLLSFCLTNGTVVQGSCAMRKAVCQEQRQVDDSFQKCNSKAAGNNARSGTVDGNNGSSKVSATIALFMVTLFVSISH